MGAPPAGPTAGRGIGHGPSALAAGEDARAARPPAQILESKALKIAGSVRGANGGGGGDGGGLPVGPRRMIAARGPTRAASGGPAAVAFRAPAAATVAFRAPAVAPSSRYGRWRGREAATVAFRAPAVASPPPPPSPNPARRDAADAPTCRQAPPRDLAHAFITPHTVRPMWGCRLSRRHHRASLVTNLLLFLLIVLVLARIWP